DWGQDLFYLKRWLEEHPEVRLREFEYFGSVDPSLAGIESQEVPRPATLAEYANAARERRQDPRPGWYAVSVNLLRSPEGRHTFLLPFRPVAMAGYSIYIYHLSLEEANRARRDMGLAELSEP